MQLVDKQHDRSGRILDFPQDRLEAVFELPAIFGSGEHGAEIEGDHLLFLERVGNIPGDDPLGESFNDRGFADSRLPDQHRVVFGAPRQDLHHPADLIVPADHRIELAAAGSVSQVARIAFQSLVLVFRVRIGHPLAAANRYQNLQDVSAVDPASAQQAPGESILCSQRQQQVFR